MTYKNVISSMNGKHDLFVYYTNGADQILYFGIKVNGGAVQVRGFKPTGSWDNPSSIVVNVTGFNTGANVVVFSPYGVTGAPDLDWMEVVP